MLLDDDEDEPVRAGIYSFSFSSIRPSYLLAPGFVLGLVAMYLPWWGIGGLFTLGSNVTGFSDWGIGYFIAWLAGTLLFLVRNVFPDADLSVRLPIADWFLFTCVGGLMVIFALTVIDFLSLGGGNSFSLTGTHDIRFGWFIAIVASVLVGAGGWMSRSSAVAEQVV